MSGYANKALVLGRIGLLRSLGRMGIPVTLAREARDVFEHASKYCKDYIALPNLAFEQEEAVDLLAAYGQRQAVKPVAFFNGESDVLLFSRHRAVLEKYYEFSFPDHALLDALINKDLFFDLAARSDLAIPETRLVKTADEFSKAGDEVGYPVVIKPIQQRFWHAQTVVDAIGWHKAVLIRSSKEMERFLRVFPQPQGNELIQEYVPGPDQAHYDCHGYIDKQGRYCASLVGRKIRTFPIHFGQGCYTHLVDEPEIDSLCRTSLERLSYKGPYNINLKRHSGTGKDYILEINPRYSLWTVFDMACGYNFPLYNYCDVLDLPLPELRQTVCSQRWLYLGADLKAARNYRKVGELSVLEWLKSYFSCRGRIEFHVFARDDPKPLFYSLWLISVRTGRRVMKRLQRIFRKP